MKDANAIGWGRTRYGLLLAILGMLTACASSVAQQQAAPPPTQGEVSGEAQAPEGQDPNTPADYRIGPGDTLSVFIYRFPEHSGTFTVRPDGKLTIPLVEDMVAVGKTPSQLARDFEEALVDYLKNPRVNIIVVNATNFIGQVRIFGEVKAPKSIPFRQGMTVLDAIEAAGGLTDAASPNKATLTRKNAEGEEVRIRLRLKDLLYKGRQSENLPLEAGDFIFVPQSWF